MLMRDDLEFHRDDVGDPRAVALDSTFGLLARFLESEVQGSLALCDELLLALDEIEAQDRATFEEVGNALSLLVDRDQACLETEVGETAATLAIPRASFRDAIERWRGFLDPAD